MIPLLHENSVYFGSLKALDRSSGELRWTRNAGFAKNAAVSGTDIAAVGGGLLVANRNSGAHRYIFSDPQSLSGNVSSDENRFYVLTHNGRALALEASSGTVAWDANLATTGAAQGFGTTLAGNDLIVTLKSFFTSPGGNQGIVAAVDKATGNVRWRVVLDTIPGGNGEAGLIEPAVVSGNLAIVHTQRHRVVALNIATGAVAWQFDASYGDPTFGNAGSAACDGRVIIATGDAGMMALDGATGAVQWKIGDFGEASLRRIECSHGTVLVLGFASLFNAATGAPIARYPRSRLMLSDLYIASATRDEHSVYVATNRGFTRFRAP